MYANETVYMFDIVLVTFVDVFKYLRSMSILLAYVLETVVSPERINAQKTVERDLSL